MNKFDEKLNKVNQELNKTSGDSDVPTLERPKTSKPSVLTRRKDNIASIRHQDKVPTIQQRHAPSRIRMWHGHNRDYGDLNTETCSDLIDGFQRAGGQQIPAIARKIVDTDEYDYEIICGARRHWTANFLKKDLLIEIRSIDDRTAFILQDLENRDRKDVSDLERSIDYKKALELYFQNDQTAMAKYLKIDVGNFNRMLYLCELPEQIIKAYSDKTDIKVHHGQAYKKFLDEPRARKVILERAKALVGKKLAGKDVFANLKRPIESKSRSVPPKEFGTASLTRQSKKSLAFKIDLSGELTASSLKKYQKDINELLASLVETEN